MPIYWPGYYGSSSGLPHVQQPLVRPPPGLLVPHSMQQPMQYPGMNASLSTGGPIMSEFPPPLLPPVSSTLNLTSTTLPTTIPLVQTAALASETSPSLIPNNAPTTSIPATSANANFPLMSPLTSSCLETNAIVPPVSSRPRAVSGPTLPYQTMSQSVPAILGQSTSNSSQTETSVPSLVTPGQLLKPGPTPSSSQSLQTRHKDVEVVQPASSEPPALLPSEAQKPILPLSTLHGHKVWCCHV
eukprot:TRINITY_DN137_c0_g1_i1.p1 TRINITY_DN137_c0_g1~~TRINITY_DN137_c0_g1_i1.p1  ORF type:complete len:243 (+),score=33.90 TRINITY_DN137_c0_g1_i1:644-1372(+)